MSSDIDVNLRRCFNRIKLSFFNLSFDRRFIEELALSRVINEIHIEEISSDSLPSSFPKRDKIDKFFSVIENKQSYREFINFIFNIQIKDRTAEEIEGIHIFTKNLSSELGKYLSLVKVHAQVIRIMHLRSKGGIESTGWSNTEENSTSEVSNITLRKKKRSNMDKESNKDSQIASASSGSTIEEPAISDAGVKTNSETRLLAIPPSNTQAGMVTTETCERPSTLEVTRASAQVHNHTELYHEELAKQFNSRYTQDMQQSQGRDQRPYIMEPWQIPLSREPNPYNFRSEMIENVLYGPSYAPVITTCCNHGSICSTAAGNVIPPPPNKNIRHLYTTYKPAEGTQGLEWLKQSEAGRGQQSRPAPTDHLGGEDHSYNRYCKQPYYSTPMTGPSYLPRIPNDSGEVDPNRHPLPMNSGSYVQTCPTIRVQNRNLNHVKAMNVPRYSGPAESKTPYDFVVELEKYQIITCTSEEVMLREVIPLALEGQAFSWFRFEIRNQPFIDWENFKSRFRREFQVLGYEHELSRELETRTQGPTEPLTAYIRVILEYIERLGAQPREEEIVKRIKRGMHPEYLQMLQGRSIRSIRDLMIAASEAQEVIKAFRSYKPPPTGIAVEPTLQWRQLDSSITSTRSDLRQNHTSLENSNPRLHPHAVDPYAYYHADSQRRSVSFSEPQLNFGTDRRNGASSPSPSANRVNTDTGRHSPGRPGTPNNNVKRCYACNSTDHLRPDCPLRSPASGNGPIPSSSTQK